MKFEAHTRACRLGRCLSDACDEFSIKLFRTQFSDDAGCVRGFGARASGVLHSDATYAFLQGSIIS